MRNMLGFCYVYTAASSTCAYQGNGHICPIGRTVAYTAYFCGKADKVQLNKHNTQTWRGGVSFVTAWKEATLVWRDLQEQQTELGWSGRTCIHTKCGIIKILIQLTVHIWGQEWNACSPCNFRAHTHMRTYTHMLAHTEKMNVCLGQVSKHWSEHTQSQGIGIDVHSARGWECGTELALCTGLGGRVCQRFWRMLQLHPGLFSFLI